MAGDRADTERLQRAGVVDRAQGKGHQAAGSIKGKLDELQDTVGDAVDTTRERATGRG